MKTIFFLLLFPFLSVSQIDKNPCENLLLINKIIQEKHYRPKPVDDSLSVYVFNDFLEKLDSDNSLFLNNEISQRKKYKFKIDNYIKDQKCDFLNQFYLAYSQAIQRKTSIITTITNEPIIYSSNENIRFTKKRLSYYDNENDLKKLYKKRILFEILSDIAQTSQKKDSIIGAFKSISENSKLKIFQNYNCEFTNKLLSKTEFVSLFINSFCSYFDPHTMFFSSSEKSNFLSGLSSSNYSFGISILINAKNEFTIADITPYGSAYYSDKLAVGDVIQKININGIDYNINCNNPQVIGKILNDTDTKKAFFTFRKNTGEIFSLELYKQLMRDYQNSVYSYILEFEKKRTGYIKIPSFYSTFENGKTNVSDDFKKEIVKLNDNKISNLIIDLEDNGGGSMDEAKKLCGFFITAPTLGQEKFSKNQIYLAGNENPKSIFNGNIVILINGQSASASEFFTNAMQDYNMATVVGTKSFGKASMQTIFEIENESKDFLKLTIGTFYRVTGKSHQQTGIVPNVIIPSIFDDQLHREKNEKQSLKNETIKSYIDSNSFPLSENTKKVILNYNSQMVKNPTIIKINKFKKIINNLFSENLAPITLNFNSVFDNLQTYNLIWKNIYDFNKTENDLLIFNSGYDAEKTNKNEILNKTNKIGIKNIKSNITIFESLKIISNLK